MAEASVSNNHKSKARWFIIPRRSKGIFVWDNRQSTFIGYQIHHGLIGAAVTAYGLRTKRWLFTTLGIVMMLDDRDDFPWLPEDRHPTTIDEVLAK